MTALKADKAWITINGIQYPLNDVVYTVEEERLIEKELEEGYDICPIYGRINIKQALADRAKAIKDKYEKFNRMYTADGLINERPRKL